MRRHSKEGSQPVKARRRKTVTRKRQNAPKARPHRSIADTHQTDLARVIRERDEALEQQAATAEVLRVISGSPGDLQAVFATMLRNVVRICDAKYGVVYRCEGDALRFVAWHNAPK